MSRSNHAEPLPRPISRAGSLALLAAVGLALMLGACQRRSRSADPLADVELTFAVEPSPAAVGPARLTFTLTDASGAPVPAESFGLRSDMTHAGMAPILAAGTEVAPGEYRVELEWSMAGDWVLTVEALLADGRSLTRAIPLTVEPAP
jgi:hypothetical protein